MPDYGLPMLHRIGTIKMKMTTLDFILRIKTDLIHTFLTTEQCGTYSVEGDCYNREHVIPQSTFNSAAPMVSAFYSAN
jgi:hypothetical protein